MCGICGIYGHHTTQEISAMMSKLEHRGNDGRGQASDGTCGLGHQRLAILDLSPAGIQPMHNENDTVWSVVNGEIYNYRELRSNLELDGHRFYSKSDSEVIVHLYEEYQEALLPMLRGMFSLAVYDSARKRLLLARDLVGKKPLYYYWWGDRLVFASEIKALFEADSVTREVNYQALPSWLNYQYLSGDRTLFRGIKKLEPAQYLVMSPGKSPAVHSYSSSSPLKWEDRPLRDLLDESTRLRLQSDVPVGSFLSGGIDSSAVTALYRKQFSGDLHTFTATFEGHSEAEYAIRVSSHLRTIYHEVPITSEMVNRDLDKITWHHDEPLGDAAVINNYYLAREAKRYVTVVLAGEGGDELFGGYPWYRYATLLDYISRIPGPIRRAVSGLVPGDVTSRTFTLERMAALIGQPSRSAVLSYPTTTMSNRNIDWLLSIRTEYPDREIPRMSPLNQMLYLDQHNLLPEKFLMKADKATMAWSVEERLPLLDRDVVYFAITAPEALKRDKRALRDSVSSLLPPDIIERPKKGFGTPVATWLDGSLHDRLVSAIRDGDLLELICFKRSREKLLELLGRKDQGSRLALSRTNVLWSLLALQTWHDVYFRRGSSCVS